MSKSMKAQLEVNNKPVELNRFAESFIAHTVTGAASSLKGLSSIDELELSYEKKMLSLRVNKEEVPLSDFPQMLITNTLKGLISSLKDVDSMESFSILTKSE